MKMHPWVNPAVDTISIRVVYKHVFIIVSVMVLGEHLKHSGRWLKRANVNLSQVVKNPGVEAKGVEKEESKNEWTDRTQKLVTWCTGGPSCRGWSGSTCSNINSISIMRLRGVQVQWKNRRHLRDWGSGSGALRLAMGELWIPGSGTQCTVVTATLGAIAFRCLQL